MPWCYPRGCYLKEMPEVAAHDEVGHQSELRRGEEQRSLRPLRSLAREPGLYLLGPYRRVGCICWADLRRWGLITALSRPATKACRRSGEGPAWSAAPTSHRSGVYVECRASFP